MKHLPEHISLPTFWNEDERRLLEGTSLEAALDAKLKSLDREFTLLRERTSSIDWCRQHWWDAETGKLFLENFLYVDAAYRSRALDLPGTGHATVPCIDMANHASGDVTNALYQTGPDGSALLLLRAGKEIKVGDELTITYGEEKGACEMLFSYGFIDYDIALAKELFLSLNVPDDDPLKMAKQAASRSAPGFRLFERGDSVDWEGDFVWLLCVNEEDGLEFRIIQSVDGEREIAVSWKGEEMQDVSTLPEKLGRDAMRDIFNLRAIATLQARVEQQLFRLEGSKAQTEQIQESGAIRAETEGYAVELRDLEETLMLKAYQDFEDQKSGLLGSRVVQEYLGLGQEGEDFS